MTLSTALWSLSNIRFNAEMGLLLAMWMAISYLGSVTLLPALLVLLPPRFMTRELERARSTEEAKG
jgi:predicted RND superfamily exporter protein